MEFLIQRDNLYAIMQAASQIVESSSDENAPIAGHVLLERQDDNLVLWATGLQMELRQIVPCNFSTDAPVRMTVSAQRLTSICQYLPDGSEMRFLPGDEKSETPETLFRVTSGATQYRVASLDPQDYALLERQEGSVQLQLDWTDLHFLFSKASVCMGKTDHRHYLCAMLLEFYPDRVRAVSTDTHRMAICDRQLEETPVGLDGENPQQLILSRKAVEKMQNFAPKQGPVGIEANANYVAFSDDTRRFVCRLVEGKYPNYPEVFPEVEGQASLQIDRVELQSGLARVGSILHADKGDTSRVVFDVNPRRLDISATNSLNERSESTLPAEYSGKAMTISFSMKYMKEVVDMLDSEQALLYFSAMDKGCVIKPDGAGSFRYLIMPLRV